MSFNQKPADRIRETDRQLKEILDRLEKIDSEYRDLSFVRDSENVSEYPEEEEELSPELQEELENEKRLLDESLNRELSQIKDPLKTEKTTGDRRAVQSHWLFVR